MRFDALDEWLRWQERLHPQAIDPGLERVAEVYRRLNVGRPGRVVVTVAGTNGKGSCAVLLERICRQAGYTTGLYTSPHLIRYNERVAVDGWPVPDRDLVEAFDAIDRARDDISLTYFEFGTLAALWLFARHAPDVTVLEVGMGGRLDATNIINADVGLITSIGLDHQQWLGETREAIATEKAGILRPQRAAVCGDPEPPASLIEAARQLPAPLDCIGRDFGFRADESVWQWFGGDRQERDLPLPAGGGAAQLRNAASVLMVLQRLSAVLPVGRPALEAGLRSALLPGRQQSVGRSPSVILDVAHNREAIAELADCLAQRPVRGRTLLVFGILRDKPVAAVIETLAPHVDAWFVAEPANERALPLADLLPAVRARAGGKPVSAGGRVVEAFADARRQASADDRIVVTGSFWTVAEVMAEYD